MIRRAILGAAIAVVSVVSWQAHADVARLVVCAPGYPSHTEQAQPTMDQLARALELAAGWDAGRIEAAYHPTAEGGLEALTDETAGLVLTPLPFYLEHRERLGLEPLLEVVHAAGEAEVWSVVARRGAIDEPSDLSGWQLAGMPGYSPRFVRNIALGEWGDLPPDTEIRFSSRVLSSLRAAASGEEVAAILDLGQAAALDSLPFAAELEVVARSGPLVGSLLCRVDRRLDDAAVAELTEAFAGLERREGEDSVLDLLRVAGFEPLDPAELSGLARRFDDERSGRQ